MSRLTVTLSLAALLGCAATTTTTPNGTSTAIGLAPGASGNASSSEVWVCHGHKKPKWKHVASPAVDAHHRHGDRVSYLHQHSGWACTQ